MSSYVHVSLLPLLFFFLHPPPTPLFEQLFSNKLLMMIQ